MKRCIACGMPMETPEQHALHDPERDYCIHCAREDGAMQSFTEKQDNLTAFLVRTQGLDEGVARQTACTMMKKLPAWESFFTDEN